jgi:hypothetical protein
MQAFSRSVLTLEAFTRFVEQLHGMMQNAAIVLRHCEFN